MVLWEMELVNGGIKSMLSVLIYDNFVLPVKSVISFLLSHFSQKVVFNVEKWRETKNKNKKSTYIPTYSPSGDILYISKRRLNS